MAEKTPALEKEEDTMATAGTARSPEAVPRDELADLRRQNEEIRTKLLYLQADFENFRKRADRDAESIARFAHEVLFSDMLPVLDEMDAAANGLDGTAGDGVKMVRENLAKVLRAVGLQEIPAQGLPFDPYLMECVEQVPDRASKDGVVKDVVRKGYRYRDRTLRPAQVIVVKNGGESDG